jgi:hypothetical protein
MDIDVFPASRLPTVLRVLRTALAPEGALEPRERAFLDTYARITAFDLPLPDPRPIAAREVEMEGAHQRKRLVQLAALAVLLSRPVKDDSLAFLRHLARHLATRDPVIDVIDALKKGRHFKARLLAMRRVMRVMLKEAHLAEGLAGVLRLLGAMLLKAPVNTDKVSRYKRLGLLPEGTLGREYWKHMTREGFNFPGEPAGIPDSVAYHDIAHVLAEHEATPLGEIQQGSFQGGNRREDGFFFIQFVILQFHHGVRITPATGPQTGHFDPALVLWAIHRGAQCNVDMTHQWDFWPLMALPLAQAREMCGLLPKLSAVVNRPRRLELVHERHA